nr:major capsid protein [Myoviridae environmental samples]
MGGSADDIWGVQPMTQPTGLIFAMKARYGNPGGTEALFNEADTEYSGKPNALFDGDGTADTNPQTGTDPFAAGLNTGNGMTITDAEGGPVGGSFNEMAFSIERTSVTAKTRALKAEYSIELAQDLKSVHGLDAENELSNILSTEIMLEINRVIFGGFSR